MDEVIEDFNPDKEMFYSLLVEYYGNPILTNVKTISEGLKMYATKLYCLLNRDCRYLIAIEKEDVISDPIESKSLHDIKWVSFQARTLPSDYFENLPTTAHAYQAEMKGGLAVLIERYNVSKEASSYRCKVHPIEVTLLHTERNTAEAYQSRGNIIIALETFQTVLTFIK